MLDPVYSIVPFPFKPSQRQACEAQRSKMGKLLRAEPEGPKFIEGFPQAKEMLRKAKWLRFIQKFRGYHREVTKAFARSFDGSEAEVGDLKFLVNEASIAAATELLQEGERWFKNKSISDEAWRTILRNQGMDITVFKRGIPVHTIKDEWATLLLIVQKFITCEGRFGSMYMYHTRILMNFLENRTLNLPYFLFNSLKKMAVTVQKHLGDVEPHLYHHGLIKILIEKELKERKDTWEQFLVRNFFEEPQEIPEGSSIRRSRRKRMNVETQITPTQEIPAASTAKRSRRKRTVDEIQDTSTITMKKNDREERLVKRKKKEIKTKKPIIPKGKEIIEAVHKTPSSEEEDHQILSEILVFLQKQSSISKKAETGT